MKHSKELKDLRGISGWLILPTLGLLIGALVGVIAAVVMALFLFEDFDAKLFIYFLLVLISGVLSVAALVLEFKKKKEFSRMLKITMWVAVFSQFILAVLYKGYISDVLIHAIFAVLWTTYLSSSKRVKNTFVN